jgi:hypothetical protein
MLAGAVVPEKLYVRPAEATINTAGEAVNVAFGNLLNLVVGTTSPRPINNTTVSLFKVRTVQSRFKSLTTSGAAVNNTVENTLPVHPR